MRTDLTVTRSDRVGYKDEQWLSIHETDCEQDHRRVSVKIVTGLHPGH